MILSRNILLSPVAFKFHVLQITEKDIFFQKERNWAVSFSLNEIKNLSQPESYRHYLNIDILFIDNLILVL